MLLLFMVYEALPALLTLLSGCTLHLGLPCCCDVSEYACLLSSAAQGSFCKTPAVALSCSSPGCLEL